MKTYLVGGAVRDMAMGKEPRDRDYVVVGSTEEEMLAKGYTKVGASFPVFLHPETGEEYALARTERSTGPGYHDFEVVFGPDVTLKEDLMRRDLTINAIAYDEEAGEYIDPFGGLWDIEKRLLRSVTDQSMIEDPLRIYRAARLYARFGDMEFDFTNDTADAMLDAIPNLKHLPKERKFAEIQKCFNDLSPGNRPSMMVDILVTLGELPELAELRSVPQPPEHHPEGDAYTHTLLVMDAAKDLRIGGRTLFAAMLHDVGKAVTYAERGNLHGHEAAGVPVTKAICERFGVPVQWQKTAMFVTKHHGRVPGIMNMTPRSVYDLLAELKVEQDMQMVLDLIVAAKCDARGRGPERENDPYVPGKFLFRVASRLFMAKKDGEFKEKSQEIALKWKGNPAMIASEVRAMKIAKVRAIMREVKSGYED